jgi:hypothetical protein
MYPPGPACTVSVRPVTRCSRRGESCGTWQLTQVTAGGVTIDGEEWQSFRFDEELRLLHPDDLGSGDPDHWRYQRAFRKQ